MAKIIKKKKNSGARATSQTNNVKKSKRIEYTPAQVEAIFKKFNA